MAQINCSYNIFYSIIFGMNPNEKELLEKTYEMAKENNHILKGIRRTNRWSTFFRIFYWIVIIGISVGAFYYIQPYINPILKAYSSLQSNISNIGSVVNKASK